MAIPWVKQGRLFSALRCVKRFTEYEKEVALSLKPKFLKRLLEARANLARGSEECGATGRVGFKKKAGASRQLTRKGECQGDAQLSE